MKFIKQVIISVLLITSITASAQKTWESDLQSEQFKQFHRGKYTKIKGNLLIQDTDLEDLTLIEYLTKVEGNIIIENNSFLVSLEGLERLVYVDGSIHILKNEKLTSYVALNKELITQGINGVELSKNIYDKFETDENRYNPTLNQLIHRKSKCFNIIYEFSF